METWAFLQFIAAGRNEFGATNETKLRPVSKAIRTAANKPK